MTDSDAKNLAKQLEAQGLEVVMLGHDSLAVITHSDPEEMESERCIISQDSQGNPIADVWICVDIEQLRKDYTYVASLWDKQQKETGQQPCDELEGLCNMLEAMVFIIDEATGT